jgi:hypothetical protein
MYEDMAEGLPLQQVVQSLSELLNYFITKLEGVQTTEYKWVFTSDSHSAVYLT